MGTKSCRIQGESVRPIQPSIRPSIWEAWISLWGARGGGDGWIYGRTGRIDSPCILQDFVPFGSIRGRCPKRRRRKTCNWTTKNKNACDWAGEVMRKSPGKRRKHKCDTNRRTKGPTQWHIELHACDWKWGNVYRYLGLLVDYWIGWLITH